MSFKEIPFMVGLTFQLEARIFSLENMKATDDYAAKVRFWAANQHVVPLPAGPRLPKFRPQKFSSHVEMNRWKEGLILQIAREAGSHG